MSELAGRVERVRLLLRSLNDPYPTPRGALAPEAGPAASKYVPCETCRRSGVVRARGGWLLCLVCDGTGLKKRTDEPEYDLYLELPLEEALRLPPTAPSRPRAGGDPGEDGFGWERALEAHERHGSYGELRRTLEWLSSANPRRYRLVRVALIDQTGATLSAVAQRELDLGVISIALRMRRVRVPYWLREPGAAETLESLAAAGMQAGEIARRLGMSKRAVRRKLKGKALGSGQAGIPLGAM